MTQSSRDREEPMTATASRVDRWLAGPQAWRLKSHRNPPVVVDLGIVPHTSQ